VGPWDVGWDVGFVGPFLDLRYPRR
jgi:hypothetical protein